MLISKFAFGPEKLTGFWRNGPRHRSIPFFSWMTKSQHYCTMHCWQSQAISRILKKKKKTIKRFSFRFHDNSDVIVTLIITNFHLYLIQLWCSFLQIFVDGDVVNAQTWEILPLKNPIEPPYGLDTFVQTKGGTHKNYPVQLKHQVPIMYQ